MSDEANVPSDEMNDDQILNYTQGIRRQFVEQQVVEGKFPADTKEQTVLLSALADMDRAAINRKRIGVSEKQAGADALAAQAIARLSRDFGAMSPFVKGDGDEFEGELDVPEPEVGHLPPAEAVPGETDVGINDDTYDDFMNRMDDQMGRGDNSENA